MKKLLLFFSIFLASLTSNAQIFSDFNLSGGIVSHKTQKLYWENGLGLDFTSEFLLSKQIHLKAGYVSSRFGSALSSNAIKQDTYTVGADWRFFPKRSFQLFTGINTGFFKAHYEDPRFDVLPSSSALLQVEAGAVYNFNLPLTFSASVGYNVLNSNGESGPGTLFPVYYQLKAFYRFK